LRAGAGSATWTRTGGWGRWRYSEASRTVLGPRLPENGAMKIRPMLVTAGPLRPDSHRYAFEVKWDGFRALIEASPSAVKVWSRNGHDMTSRYPELQELKASVTSSVILDGEIVCLDDKGNPDFAALWFRSRGSRTPAVCFMAFDVLEVGGRATIDEPYRERRRILEELDLNGPHWCTPEIHIEEGAALFAATKEMGLEGVVAKRLDSRYRPGLRSKSWTKTKHFQTRNFALLGWLPPEEWRQDRGCVVLGLRSEAGIAVAGVVESGYGRDLVEQLPALTRRQLRSLQQPGRIWQGDAPMVGEVKYLEWSPAGGLRHATLTQGSRD
jgi:bifunctional non-homologous end joining protein LigD